MAIIPQGALFDWSHIEAASDLDRLRLVLDALPDEPLMRVLEALRGRGRNAYPVRPTWNALLAGVVFQHSSIAALRRELQRNGELRTLCGFDALRGAAAVPTDSAFSRFLVHLLAQEPLVRALFDTLLDALHPHLTDLGRILAVDGKALPSFGTPPKKGAAAAAPAARPGRRRDHDADWGVKRYRGTRANGTPWETVVTWFGFELHLVVDAVHELPLHYQVTRASAPETTALIPLVQATRDRHPAVLAACHELSADRGYDSAENNRALYDDYGIRPVIAKRSDWKDPDPTRPLYPDRIDTIVYDVQGHVSCLCPATGEQRAMAPWGFEAARGTLKYRCPAVAGGYPCAGRAQCPGAQGAYGRVVRIPLAADRRLFTPLARDSAAWTRAYKRRTAVERVNSRLDCLLGFEHHTIRGLRKMQTRVGLALAVLLAMALGRLRAGQRDQMRSLLAPVRRAA